MHPAAVAAAALTQQQQGQCRRLATRPLQLIFAQNIQMSRMLLYEIPMARKAYGMVAARYKTPDSVIVLLCVPAV